MVFVENIRLVVNVDVVDYAADVVGCTGELQGVPETFVGFHNSKSANAFSNASSNVAKCPRTCGKRTIASLAL